MSAVVTKEVADDAGVLRLLEKCWYALYVNAIDPVTPEYKLDEFEVGRLLAAIQQRFTDNGVELQVPPRSEEEPL